eukprot:scpid93437/ scgid30755/ 
MYGVYISKHKPAHPTWTGGDAMGLVPSRWSLFVMSGNLSTPASEGCRSSCVFCCCMSLCDHHQHLGVNMPWSSHPGSHLCFAGKQSHSHSTTWLSGVVSLSCQYCCTVFDTPYCNVSGRVSCMACLPSGTGRSQGCSGGSSTWESCIPAHRTLLEAGVLVTNTITTSLTTKYQLRPMPGQS